VSPRHSRGGPLTTDRPTAESPGTEFIAERTPLRVDQPFSRAVGPAVDLMALWCPYGQATPHPEWPLLCDCGDCIAAARASSTLTQADLDRSVALFDARRPHPDFAGEYLRSVIFRFLVHCPDLPWTDPLHGWPVRLRWDAEPPAEKFELLALIEPRFERSYCRRRPDLRDQSDSSYDFSLALFAFDAGWTCQEVADLLIAGRREHGDISKPGKALRRDYQERTLLKALLQVARRTL
jgi:hypothetical protein